MFLLYTQTLPPKLIRIPFGLRFEESNPKPDFVITFETEIKKSAMGAQRFFEYVYECWSNCSINCPEAFFVVNDEPSFEDLLKRRNE